MNKSIISLIPLLLAGCIQAQPTTADTKPTAEPIPTSEPISAAEPTAEPETYNSCIVIGYRTLQYTPDYSEEVAVAIDSFGHEHLLNISDAIVGDEYTIRYGVITEQTFEGWSEENDYYIVQFENGDLHEIESDDLQPGDEVTVYFYEDRPIRTMYGWR